MQKGQIISNVSNVYQVKIKNTIVECVPRGKMKQREIVPVVGDCVEIEFLEKEISRGVIVNILPRSMYCKRPKLANLTQMIFVISLKEPKPDFLLLDKQLIYAEYLNIKPIICINKIDLGKREQIQEIKEIYEKIGYQVIYTNAKELEGIEELKKLLNNQITAFSGNSGVRKVKFNKWFVWKQHDFGRTN